MHSIQIYLLGGLTVQWGDNVITRFSTQKTAALLAYLAWQRGKPQPREHLVEMLWPASTPQAGRASLSMALSSLRHQLEPPGVPSATVLMADRFSVKLNTDVVETDIDRFETAIEAARKTPGALDRAVHLREAAALYTGSLLPGFYEDWVGPEQQRLASLYYQAVHQLIRHEVRAGDLDRALALARDLVQREPLREEAHHDLMRLLAAAGQPAAALRHFRELEQTLRRELGSAPSAASRQIARDIEQLGAPPLPDAPEEPVGASASAVDRAAERPTGTVTFVAFEARQDDDTVAESFRQNTLRNGGSLVRYASGSGVSAFERATDGLTCALAVQQSAGDPPRMALHTGEVSPDEAYPAYRGEALDRTYSLLAAANPGQLLATEVCAALLRPRVEPGAWSLVDLGAYRLPGAPEPGRLYQVALAGTDRRSYPVPRAEAAHSPQIPAPVTRFFGRSGELAELAAVLVPAGTGDDRRRLITILGPGGTGKTRLAIEAARRAAGPFAGAVWFVPLAELPDDADLRQVAETISEALGAAGTAQDPFDQIAGVLTGRPALVVLDNLEQIVAAAADIVQRLLRQSPALTLLATTRHRLELSEEIEFALKPLETPSVNESNRGKLDVPSPRDMGALSRIESVQLFVDRAQSVKPDFQLTAANADAVSKLCSRLEGIPLALELAAARAQVLTPAQMLVQLSKQASRFDLLVSRKRDLAERHRTLRGAIEWSFRLLAPGLQSFMARLSVFRGGWSLEAAEEVLDEPLALDFLAQLRECSLVVAEDGPTSGSTEPTIRFRMLETLREFAADALAHGPEADKVLHSHLAFFLTLAEEADRNLRGPDQVAWLDRLATEHDNLRAALRFALTLETGDDSALRMAAALWRFWAVRGFFTEGRAWCDEVLAHSESDIASPYRVAALNGAGLLAMHLADYAEARRRFESALLDSGSAGYKDGEAEALRNLGILASDQKRFEDARDLHQRALDIWTSSGDPQGMASGLSNLGLVSIHLGDMARAREALSQSLAITRSLGNWASAANTLNTLGMLAYRQQEYPAAAEAFRESLEMERQVGNPRGVATALLNLGSIEAELDDFATAHTHLCEAVEQLLHLGDRRILAHAVNGLAVLAGRLGLSSTAARTFGTVEALCESAGLESLSSRTSDDAEIAAVRGTLGGPEFERLWLRGRTLDLREAIDAARRETSPDRLAAS